MIDAKVFAAMKPTSYFINVARGGVVDEDALVEALRDKKIAARRSTCSDRSRCRRPSVWDLQERHHHHPPGRLLRHLCRSRHADPGAQHALLPQGDLKGMINVARPAA
jgi:hypothetical protein